MHELSLAEAILPSVLAIAEEHRARVMSLTIQAGALQMIVAESLAMGFLAVAEGTAAEGARLIVEPVAVTARCRRCELVFGVEDSIFLCPDCHVADAETVTGNELVLLRVELEPCESMSSTTS
ncbi:MAG: hydrogenase maturation nickel metallochaperone HypA [Armatimonadetes bacterium]|nr:hydrogenase maturation nickel metallochaperone HypA [Armatimonadota bacterium]